jgi:phosphopantothenoylcysteine decarboxylase/phosphopantothenate--cysteine ligase
MNSPRFSLQAGSGWAGRRVLFLLTGSISAFKACHLLSAIAKAGAEVQVVASPWALRFIGAATLEGLSGRAVRSDLFEAGSMMDHIHLVRNQDLVIQAPATAHSLNRMAAGLADDLIGALFLAWDRTTPWHVFPAMNTQMLNHPATQRSLQVLQGWGVKPHLGGRGELACGEFGDGRLMEPDDMLSELERALASAAGHAERPVACAPSGPARNKPAGLSQLPSPPNAARPTQLRPVLITSGGTREPIDSVRAITNTSSGRTGAAIAEAFTEAGFAVHLLLAESAVRPRLAPSHERKFISFQDLRRELESLLGEHDYAAVIHAAAVSDFSVAAPASTKIESDRPMTLHLTPNPKLVDLIRPQFKSQTTKLVAFKLTSQATAQERTRAAAGLAARARPDWIVSNDLSQITADQHNTELLKVDRATGAVTTVDRANEKASLGELLVRVILKEEIRDSLS